MGKSRIKNENFYTVLGWMLNTLELKGNELIIFAIIYSFSQDGESSFSGSLSYLQTFANIKSHNTVLEMLRNLVEKNLIIKTEYKRDNVRRVAYKANLDYIDEVKGLVSKLKPDNTLNLDD